MSREHCSHPKSHAPDSQRSVASDTVCSGSDALHHHDNTIRTNRYRLKGDRFAGSGARSDGSPRSYVADIVLLVGFAASIRIVVAFLTRGYEVDLQYFRDWGRSFRESGIGDFYRNTPTADHLPGDLYVHALVARVTSWFGVSTESRTYDLIMKLLPSALDLILIVTVVWMLRPYVSRAILLALASFIAINPALIMAGAFWGQWDVYSTLLLIIMAAIGFRHPGRWMFTAPIGALIVCTKPNLLLPMIPLVLAMMIRRPLGADVLVQRIREGFIFLLLAFVSMVLVLSPFQVALPFLPGEVAYLDLVQRAIDKFQFTTLGASNIWSIPLQGYGWRPDLEVTRLGISSRSIGTLLLAAAIAFTISIQIIWSVRSRTLTAVVWSMTMISMAMFMLPTRVHERYMLPAAILAIILVGFMAPRAVAIVIAVSMSIALSLNLFVIYSWAGLPAGVIGILWATSTFLNVASFVMLATVPGLIWWNSNRRVESV